MQVLAPEAPSIRLGLVRYLASVSHREATRAPARLVLFSQEKEVRLAAIQGLKVRRERDYTDILRAGLRYPWPAVAGRAADAIVKVERTDLIPALSGAAVTLSWGCAADVQREDEARAVAGDGLQRRMFRRRGHCWAAVRTPGLRGHLNRLPILPDTWAC